MLSVLAYVYYYSFKKLDKFKISQDGRIWNVPEKSFENITWESSSLQRAIYNFKDIINEHTMISLKKLGNWIWRASVTLCCVCINITGKHKN